MEVVAVVVAVQAVRLVQEALLLVAQVAQEPLVTQHQTLILVVAVAVVPFLEAAAAQVAPVS